MVIIREQNQQTVFFSQHRPTIIDNLSYNSANNRWQLVPTVISPNYQYFFNH